MLIQMVHGFYLEKYSRLEREENVSFLRIYRSWQTCYFVSASQKESMLSHFTVKETQENEIK